MFRLRARCSRTQDFCRDTARTMSQENVEIVRLVYEAIDRSDAETVLAL